MASLNSTRRELVAQQALKEGMSCLPSGVVVVTSWIEGRAWGTTVSSCSSLSLAPPLVLICLTSKSVSARAVMEQQCFGVNILRDSQSAIADRAAAEGEPKFIDELVREELTMGSPVLKGTLAWIHCELYNALGVGDHIVMIGEVSNVELGAAGEPLLYHRREFRQLGASVSANGTR
jgi:flavin reductase (DIM6/NTAB) family NADH-FMN oxidoreductase RutF